MTDPDDDSVEVPESADAGAADATSANADSADVDSTTERAAGERVDAAWVASVALVWLLAVLAAAVELVASGVVPAAPSLAATASLLVAGGLLLALAAGFVDYFTPGRLFRGSTAG